MHDQCYCQFCVDYPVHRHVGSVRVTQKQGWIDQMELDDIYMSYMHKIWVRPPAMTKEKEKGVGSLLKVRSFPFAVVVLFCFVGTHPALLKDHC